MIVASEERFSRRRFAHDVADGLQAVPPQLNCLYLYDSVGSDLFEAICRQPEYYQTRTEGAILRRHARDIADITGPVVLVELGSGLSVKTDHLLAAYARGGTTVDYLPIDVSRSALERAAGAIVGKHPTVSVTGIAGTYEAAFPLLGRFSPLMVVFLGSTIGNLTDAQADRFWQRVAESLVPGDFFLLGIDLVKDERVLNAAYNDAAGVTADFTRNIFARCNRELGAALDLARIEHVARYNSDRQRVEITNRFRRTQSVRLEPIDETVVVAEGTSVLIEISRKFLVADVAADLARHGLAVRQVYTDERDWFAVLLLERSSRD